jgi:hypothetical protein
MKQVYLSGPIAGLNFAECTVWRERAESVFKQAGVHVRNPMRGRIYKDEHVRVTADTPLHEVVIVVDPSLNTDHGITTRDYQDTVTSDVLFVNLFGATTVSIGTVMEIAWAGERRIPVVVVMEESGNPHEHPMLRDKIDFRTPLMGQGLQVALSLLGIEHHEPYVHVY